jgi:phosphoribosylformylglycinamidine synthase subunit PurL
LMSTPPEYAQKAWLWTTEQLPNCDVTGINGKSWNDVLLTLLDTPTIASKRWVYRQYDHQVQNNTVLLPGGADAALIRIRPQESIPKVTNINPHLGVAATVDCNSRYVYLNPLEGAKMVVAEAARNLSCVGAEPVAVTDNLNFGSPEKPIGYWQLANACQGLSLGCIAFNTPVTGGNVSLYNETIDSEGNPQPIYPTPVVGMVGIMHDITKACGQGFKNISDVIYLLGEGTSDQSTVTLGASEYLAGLHNTIAGLPPQVNFELEKAVQSTCRYGINQGWIKSAHDSAEGGLTVCLAESCISGQKGANISLPKSISSRWDEVLFGEGGARIVVSVNKGDRSVFEEYLQANLPGNWQVLGTVTDKQELVISTGDHQLINLALKEMIDTWSNAIDRRLNG